MYWFVYLLTYSYIYLYTAVFLAELHQPHTTSGFKSWLWKYLEFAQASIHILKIHVLQKGTYIYHVYIYIYIHIGCTYAYIMAYFNCTCWGAPKWKFRKKWCSLSKAGLSIFAASMCVLKFFWGGRVGWGTDKCKLSYSHVLGPFFWKSTMVVKALGCETCMTLRRNYCRFYWKRYQIEGCQYVYRSSSWKFYVDKPMFRPFRWCGLFPGVFFLPVVIFLDSSMYFPISRL